MGWQERRALPIRISNIPVDEKILELALQHNLAIYDASYLSLAPERGLPIGAGEKDAGRSHQIQ
jgi:predicted nucleic acid-binding protein